jgi:hypothetical protein
MTLLSHTVSNKSHQPSLAPADWPPNDLACSAPDAAPSRRSTPSTGLTTPALIDE